MFNRVKKNCKKKRRLTRQQQASSKKTIFRMWNGHTSSSQRDTTPPVFVCSRKQNFGSKTRKLMKRGEKQDVLAQSDVSSRCGHAPMRARVGWF
jgi:hypothetical protein